MKPLKFISAALPLVLCSSLEASFIIPTGNAVTNPTVVTDNAGTGTAIFNNGIRGYSGTNDITFRVNDVLDDPIVGDGYTLGVTSAGGGVSFRANINSFNGNPAYGSRFTITPESGVTSVNFTLMYDLAVLPSNPDRTNPGFRAEAIVALLEAGSGTPGGGPLSQGVVGDLTFNGLSAPISNPNTDAAVFNGGGNFTLNPVVNSNGTGVPSGIWSFVDQTFNGSATGFTLNVTPEGGGTFDGTTQFILTLDGTFVPVPEPSAMFFAGLSGLVLFRRRRN